MPMQKDLAILSEERRIAGLPGLSSRQKLCWALRHYSKDDLRDQNAAWNAMQALRDAVKATPPARNAFKKLIQALDSNMTMESAAEISESEKLNLLEDMMSVIPDFTTQFEFHLEAPRSERTYANLKSRIQELVDRDQRKAQRDQQQQQFSKQLGGKGQGQADGQKGLAGRTDRPSPSPKAAGYKDLEAQVAKLKEQAAYKDKQISGLSGQMKEAGLKPDFQSIKQQAAERALAGTKCKERGRSSSPSKGKGKKGRSSSAGSEKGCFICGSKDHWKGECPKAGQYTPQNRPNSPTNPQASSAERKAKSPCYNHRPWSSSCKLF